MHGDIPELLIVSFSCVNSESESTRYVSCRFLNMNNYDRKQQFIRNSDQLGSNYVNGIKFLASGHR